jgi:predicted Zn-dependent protease
LILTSYPEAIADRYLGKSPLFQEAFLLAQEGREAESLKLWSQVAPEEQDDLYFFELGSLLGRVGELDKARRLLESALDKNPELLLAVDALIPVLITLGDFEGAEKQLRRMRDAGIDPAFCHAQLATVYARQGDVVRAVEEVRAALNKGNADQAFFVFAAKLLEHQGAADEAEGLLKRLPASGCKGGVNLPLAEFWLRHKRELGKILDTFNAACREDPQNPRWQLRVAQTYMARNWTKDGIKLLKKVVDDPRLEPELAEEARSLLDEALV